jgi:CheY-like chemotaxis protein
LKEQDFGHGLKSCPPKRKRMMGLKKKILIAEDEAIFAMSMQRVLIRSGYDVSEPVSTGEEAVKRAKEEKPDLVIMDVMLKGKIDGIEAAMDIRSTHDMPIVFISGYQEEKLLERAKSVGSSIYLIKPIKPQDLELAINQSFEKQTFTFPGNVFPGIADTDHG